MVAATDTPPGPLPAVDVAGLSREGRRASNEDSAAWVAYGPGSSVAGYAVVCDGMGGHNAGEVASSMALRLLQARIGELAAQPEAAAEPAALAERVGAWIAEINLAIFKGAAANADHAGMGTTLALALAMANGRLVVANVGDSKVFLVRGVVVQQLSVDHTALAEQRRLLNRDGGSALDDAANPFFHALTRSLGQEAEVVPDIRSDLVLKQGDLVVVTSDGVTDVLESERFLSIVESAQSLPEVAETTYRLAFEAGSKDNITVALLANGRPVRLGSAPASQGDADLDGTIPIARVRAVPQPVSGATAMADAGKAPAAPPATPRSLRGLRPPALIAAAAAVGCLAALVVWLTRGPSAPEEAPRPAPAPTAVVPRLEPRPEATPPAPAPPSPVVEAPTEAPETRLQGRATPGDGPRAAREPVPTPAGVTVVRVPTATPRQGTGLPLPAIAQPAPTVLPVVVPTATPPPPPTPRPTERPTPTEAPVAPAPPQAPELDLVVPGREAALVDARVRVLRKKNRYRFEFDFDRGVREPSRSELKDDSIRVLRIQVSNRNVALGDQNVGGWGGYPLRYVRGLGAERRPSRLSFDLLDNKTNFAGDRSLRNGERLELDLSGLEWLFGSGRTTISAPVFAADE